MTTDEPRSDDTAADGRPLPADAKGGRVENLRIELGAEYPPPNEWTANARRRVPQANARRPSGYPAEGRQTPAAARLETNRPPNDRAEGNDPPPAE